VSVWSAGDVGIVEFPDGRRVRGTSVRRPHGGLQGPDLRVYLLGRDPRIDGRAYRWVRWRDFGLPSSTEDALDALREAHSRAAVERVEVACAGGIGRTGTALSVLAIMSGIPADEAVAWVRSTYHPKAVETVRQRRWIERVASSVAP
jgi:protein-tyrosine phosphatase